MTSRLHPRIMVLVLAFLIASPPMIDAAAQNALNIMALSGTTGLTLLKVFEEQPSLGRGVTAVYSVVKNAEQMTAKAISGEADIAALPTSTATLLYNKGVAVKIAAVTNWGVSYIVGSTAVASWRELKGKEIGVTGRGSAPDILFRLLLTANGLDPEKDIRIQYYPTPAELAQMVIAGKVVLASLPEPWATEATTGNRSVRILLDFQEEWRRLEKRSESYPQSCLVVQEELARENPAAVSAFLKEAAVSSAWVVANPAAAAPLAQKYLQISPEAAREAIPRCNLRFIEASAAKPEIEYYLQRLLSFEPQSIGGRLPDAAFYWQK